jgi:hypothetical protein
MNQKTIQPLLAYMLWLTLLESTSHDCTVRSRSCSYFTTTCIYGFICTKCTDHYLLSSIAHTLHTVLDFLSGVFIVCSSPRCSDTIYTLPLSSATANVSSPLLVDVLLYMLLPLALLLVVVLPVGELCERSAVMLYR